MYSPIMSDDDAADEVDDVTGSFGDTSGGRGTFVIAGSAPEGDRKQATMSKDSAAECSRGSSDDNDQMKVSADRSSESVDRDSEIADRDDGDDEDDVSDYLTDYTISESLEEKDKEALALERSSGLAQSTGETFEYVDSDAPSGSLTPVNEDLEMTLRVKDVGLPIAQSTMIDDSHSTDESRDAGNILLQSNGVEVTAADEEHREASVDVRDLSTNDSKDDEDHPRFQHDNLEQTADQQRHQVTSAIESGARSELGQQDFKQDRYTYDSKGDDGVNPPENDHLDLTADKEDDQEDSSATRSDVESELEQPEFKQDSVDGGDLLGQTVSLEELPEELVASSTDHTSTVPDDTEDNQDSGSLEYPDDEDVVDRQERINSEKDFDKDNTLPQDLDLSLTNPDPSVGKPNEDQNDGGSVLGHTVTLKEVSEGCSPSKLELEQVELSGDDEKVLGRTVSLAEASEALVASSSDQTTVSPDVVEDLRDSGSLKNPDDEDAVVHEKWISAVKDFDNDVMQNKEYSSQQDGGEPSSTNPDPFTAEANLDPNDDGGSVLGHTVTLREVMEDGSSSSDGHAVVDINSTDRQKESDCDGEEFDENRTPNVRHPASKPDQDVSVSALKDTKENTCCKVAEEDLAREKGQNLQQGDKHLVSEAGMPIATSLDNRPGEQEDRTLKESQSVCQDTRNPYTSPDLLPAAPTKDCLQLAVMSTSAAEEAERQLEVAQSVAASNTWCEDEDKKNLLCLLDSRRRTEMDNNNWQLARHIQDNMSLVKDAELDDLENVQVSVKVSQMSST